MRLHKKQGIFGALSVVVLFASGVVTLGTSPAASAALLTNGSFESGTYTFGSDGGADLAPGSTAITGWTVITNHVAPLNSGAFSITAQNGNVSLDLQGYTDSAPYGGVSQDVATTPGTQYSLSFWIGVQNSISYAVGPASVTASAGSTSQTFTNTLSAAGIQWEQFNLDFTAPTSSTTISLSGASTAGGAYIGLDNVTLTATGTSTPSVPLPAAFWTGLTLLVVITGAHRAHRLSGMLAR